MRPRINARILPTARVKKSKITFLVIWVKQHWSYQF